MEIPPQLSRTGPPPGVTADSPTWQVAQKLETAFLSEMLKAAEPRGTLAGGDAGETSQFASFLRQAQVEGISRAGGIGIARQLIDALQRQV